MHELNGGGILSPALGFTAGSLLGAAWQLLCGTMGFYRCKGPWWEDTVLTVFFLIPLFIYF